MWRLWFHRRQQDQYKRINHNPKSKSVPCKECDFIADSQDTLKKHMKVAMGHKVKKPCRYFLRGTCKFGSRCRFLHSTENETNYIRRPQISKPRIQCKFYGKCTKFPNCAFAHKEICQFQEKCSKKHCQFVHLTGYFLDQWRQTVMSM